MISRHRRAAPLYSSCATQFKAQVSQARTGLEPVSTNVTRPCKDDSHRIRQANKMTDLGFTGRKCVIKSHHSQGSERTVSRSQSFLV